MNTWTIDPSESEAYREQHGSSSLMLYAGRGRHFVCKHHDGNGAVLVELGAHAELAVTAEEYKAEFFLAFMDESTFYFGAPEVKESAERQLTAYLEAKQFCIEQDRSARVLSS